jgi:hypothetical protein
MLGTDPFMKSNPFPFLKCLNKFRPHNPFIMPVLRHRHAIIARCQCAPPMRLASGELAAKVECVGEMAGKITIQQMCSTALCISEFFGKLCSSNRVFRRVAMRPEHCPFFVRNAVSVTHREQRSFELFNGCNWSWVTKFVHKILRKTTLLCRNHLTWMVTKTSMSLILPITSFLGSVLLFSKSSFVIQPSLRDNSLNHSSFFPRKQSSIWAY